MRGIVTIPMLSVIDSNVIKIENGKGVIHNGMSMSLFQDLKLKRRKVDSRCSSDGESIGTSESTSSLSPDAQTTSEGSPKQDKDRCLTPEELVAPVSSKAAAFPPQIFFMIKSETAARNKVPYNHFLNNNNNNNNNNNVNISINGSSNITTTKHQNGAVNGVTKLTNGSSNGVGIVRENGEIVVKSEPMDLLLPAGNVHSHNGINNGTNVVALGKINGMNGKDMRGRSSSPEDKLSSSPSSSPSSASSPSTTTIHPETGNVSNSRSNSNSPRTTNGHSSDTESIASQSSAISRASNHSAVSIKREKASNHNNSSNSNVCSPTTPESDKDNQNNTKDSNNFTTSSHMTQQRRKSPPLQRSPSSSSSSSSSPAANNNNNGTTNTSRLESTLTITKHNNSKEALVNGSRRIPSPQSLSQQQYSEHNNNNNNNSTQLHYHNGVHAPHTHHLHTPQSNHLHARLTAGPDSPHNNNRSTSNGNSNSSMNIHVHSPLVHSEIRNLTEKPDPLSVVTSTSLSFHHHSMYRINGVRPEVISGGAVTPTTTTTNSANTSPNSSNHSNSSSSANSNHHLNHHHHHHLQSNNNSPNSSSGGGLLPVQSSNQSRIKSPSSLSHHSSRSPNSSPTNSNSSGSIINGSLHSPGTTTIVAGGSLGMMVNSSTGPNGAGVPNGNNHHHHVNLNRTPTVIMGEAGGVRTMLWSQPGQPIPTPGVDLNTLASSMSPPNSNITTTTSSPTHGYGSLIINNNNNSNNPSTTTADGHSVPSSINHNNTTNNNNNSPSANNNHHHPTKVGMSMERLWEAQALNLSTSPNRLPNGQSNGHGNTNGHVTNGHGTLNAHTNGHSQTTNPDDDDYEQPMICMICEDRATGLHYGIITCEGCKGFFKRTVQNRRVYTCVADGTCEITKAQRNRCQYCRFKKCIEQGMVLQAVREDRMPGGRNSGAVYNLYKVPVKYRKHKKGNRVAAGKAEKIQQQSQQQPQQPNPPVQSGNILKTALTSPNDVTHLRPSMPFETAHTMITQLVSCDNFHDIAALQNWEELLEARGDLSDKLCQMGDSIVYRLVQWTKRLPFYPEVPVDVHTRVLTHKWHELLVLTTSAWQAMHTPGPPLNVSAEEETMESLQVLQRCLQAMMGRCLTLEQLRQDVGQMVERLTYLTRAFRRMNIRIEEYVCLKVITMLQNTGTRSPEVGLIQERYIKCLRTFLEVSCPNHPNRLSELLRTLPEVHGAAQLLLESKMFYVPFLLNSALLQR